MTGRLSDVYESTPNSGGYYHTATTYYGNGAVNTLAGVPGMPSWIFGLDSMGRLNNVAETTNCNGTCQTLLSSTSYNLGRVSAINYGSGDSDTFTYSSTTGLEFGFTLNQGTNYVSSTLTWFPTGYLQQQQISDTVSPNSAQTCTYDYDSLYRLTGDNCGSVWSQTFTYDQFGNIVKSGSSSFVVTYNGNNQIATIATYDAAGNMLTINTGTQHTYTWDAENRVAVIDGKGLTYDALDRVVEEQTGSTTLQILYGPTGKLAIQSGQTNKKVYLHLPKGAMATYDVNCTACPGLYYIHPDFMGNGILGTSPSQTKIFDRFFAPFGEVYLNHNWPTSAIVFTGMTQDLDPNLYDFAFREQSPVQGRWLNPDPSGMSAVSLGDPQTLNRYSYVRNSAMGMVDPNGLGNKGFYAYMMSLTDYDGGGGGDLGDIGLMTADEAAAQQLAAAQKAAQGTTTGAQNQSKTCGFFCGLGQRFSNLLSGRGFHTNPSVTVTVTNTLTLPDGTKYRDNGDGQQHSSDPGLRPGDVPAGRLADGVFQKNAATWRNASGAANTAFVATGMVVGVNGLAMIGPVVASAIRPVLQLGRTIALNPDTASFVSDFSSGISPAPPIPASYGGFAGITAGEVYDWWEEQ